MIPITRPDVGVPEADAAAKVIQSGWLTQGPEVAAFEQDFAEAVGADHAVAVSNCTTALHLALVAAGVRAGDEVILPSHTFIACANAVRQCGAVPVFVDIEPESFNIDPDLVEAAITPLTRAILCVHQIGMPADLARILPLARQHGIQVIEDAACAVGSEIWLDGQWRRIGEALGDVACFSFHPRKLLTTGDGGMLTTANEAWDREFRLLRQHGMNVPDTVRHTSSTQIFESYPVVGFNYRMTDVQAAIGRQQLRRLTPMVAQRRSLAASYRSLLDAIPGVKAPHEPAWAHSNWQSYCVRLPLGSNQRTVMQFMLDRGIATRRGIMCIHREEAYRDQPTRSSLLQSERAQDECILLPMFSQMTFAMQQKVVAALADALSTACGKASQSVAA